MPNKTPEVSQAEGAVMGQTRGGSTCLCDNAILLNQLTNIKAHLRTMQITSVGLWSHNESDSTRTDAPDTTTVVDKLEVSDMNEDGMAFLAAKFWLNWVGLGSWREKSVFKFWKIDTSFLIIKLKFL